MGRIRGRSSRSILSGHCEKGRERGEGRCEFKGIDGRARMLDAKRTVGQIQCFLIAMT